MTILLPSTEFDPWRTASASLCRAFEETPGVKTYEIALDDDDVAAQYSWQPGQFNMLYVPGVGEAAISISGTDKKHRMLRHTIRRVGAVTAALDRGDAGMPLGLRGPFGRAWPVDEIERSETKHDIVIVAGGIGLAPLRSLITYLLDHSDRVGRVSVLVGAREPCDLLYSQHYATWAEKGLSVQTTVDRDVDSWIGNVGVVTLLVDRLSLPRPKSTLLMTCGPEIMMRYVADAALDRGIPSENIWVTLERNMNCAIGLCGHCQLGPEFICKDGPVFPYDRVAPWLHVQGL